MLIPKPLERWLSGRKRRFAKPMKEYSFRRFESCLLRLVKETGKREFFRSPFLVASWRAGVRKPPEEPRSGSIITSCEFVRLTANA